MRWLFPLLLAGCTAQAAPPVVTSGGGGGGGGGGGATVTTGTYATIEALSPTAGDIGFYTDSMYSHAIYDGSDWQPFFLGRRATPPADETWTDENLAVGSSTSETGGVVRLDLEDESGFNWQGVRVTASAGNRYTACMLADQLNFSGVAGGNGAYGIGLLETASNVLLMASTWSTTSNQGVQVDIWSNLDGSTQTTSIRTSTNFGNQQKPGWDGVLCIYVDFNAGDTADIGVAPGPYGPWEEVVTGQDVSSATAFTTRPDAFFAAVVPRNNGTDGHPNALLWHYETEAH